MFICVFKIHLSSTEVPLIDGKLIPIIIAPPKGGECLCSSPPKVPQKIDLFVFVE